MNGGTEVVVSAVRALARDVLGIELSHRSGAPLPGAAPGAHIDLALPNGLSGIAGIDDRRLAGSPRPSPPALPSGDKP